MTTKKRKSKLNIDAKRDRFIRAHPKLSASKIHQRWKGTPLKLRRSEALRRVRIIRSQRGPSRKKRAASVPKKFRRIDAPTPSERPPSSEYTISRIKDNKGNEYWIKYTDDESRDRQIRILGNYYQTSEDSFEILETKPYTEFVSDEFKF